MKKLMTILLSIIVLGCVFTGCSKDYNKGIEIIKEENPEMTADITFNEEDKTYVVTVESGTSKDVNNVVSGINSGLISAETVKKCVGWYDLIDTFKSLSIDMLTTLKADGYDDVSVCIKIVTEDNSHLDQLIVTNGVVTYDVYEQ